MAGQWWSPGNRVGKKLHHDNRGSTESHLGAWHLVTKRTTDQSMMAYTQKVKALSTMRKMLYTEDRKRHSVSDSGAYPARPRLLGEASTSPHLLLEPRQSHQALSPYRRPVSDPLSYRPEVRCPPWMYHPLLGNRRYIPSVVRLRGETNILALPAQAGLGSEQSPPASPCQSVPETPQGQGTPPHTPQDHGTPPVTPPSLSGQGQIGDEDGVEEDEVEFRMKVTIQTRSRPQQTRESGDGTGEPGSEHGCQGDPERQGREAGKSQTNLEQADRTNDPDTVVPPGLPDNVDRHSHISMETASKRLLVTGRRVADVNADSQQATTTTQSNPAIPTHSRPHPDSTRPTQGQRRKNGPVRATSDSASLDTQTVNRGSDTKGKADSSQASSGKTQSNASSSQASSSGIQCKAGSSQATVSGIQGAKAGSSQATVSGIQGKAGSSQASSSGNQGKACSSQASSSDIGAGDGSSQASSAMLSPDEPDPIKGSLISSTNRTKSNANPSDTSSRITNSGTANPTDAHLSRTGSAKSCASRKQRRKTVQFGPDLVKEVTKIVYPWYEDPSSGEESDPGSEESSEDEDESGDDSDTDGREDSDNSNEDSG